MRLGEPKAGELAGVGVVYQDLLVTCSAGTYIRALGRDLGKQLRVGAHLVALRRLQVGSFDASGGANPNASLPAYSLQELSQAVAAGEELPLVSLDAVCSELFPSCQVTPEVLTALGYGQRPEISSQIGDDLGTEDPDTPENLCPTSSGPRNIAIGVASGGQVAICTKFTK